MLAQCMHCFYDGSMPNITIRNFDPNLHDALKRKANVQGISLQEFLTNALSHIAEKRTNAEIIREHRERMKKEPGAWATRVEVMAAVAQAKEERDNRWKNWS